MQRCRDLHLKNKTKTQQQIAINKTIKINKAVTLRNGENDITMKSIEFVYRYYYLEHKQYRYVNKME